ncbi:hypothetical protein RRG08_000663 [Elysia crispata]|uniref:Uncharacterized protein n=1 Tax=Elysia crispata TaxID=231223 RepID=A0AAE0Y8I2_9GAST|nr:hypothetical protein RRG08_000663 [Elysia crispata]
MVSQAIASRFLPSTRTGCLHKSYQFFAPPSPLLPSHSFSVGFLGGSTIDSQRTSRVYYLIRQALWKNSVDFVNGVLRSFILRLRGSTITEQ